MYVAFFVFLMIRRPQISTPLYSSAASDVYKRQTTQRLNESLPEMQRKQIGQKKGATFETKKAKIMKERIQKMAKDFDGSMKDKEVIEILGINRNTYYKYKKELLLSNIK